MYQTTVKFKNSVYFLLGIMAFAISAPTLAADTPASISGATVVTAVRAKALQDQGAIMVDARVANEYVEQHIKGAINIPYKEKSDKSVNFDASKDKFNTSKLPANKSAEIVIYCNGPECWKSFKASTAAVKAGYVRINWLRGGMPEWKEKELPVE